MLEETDSDEKSPIKVERDFIRKKITQKDIEKWEVAQLDSDIEPRSKPSDVFERLEKKRKIRHENLLQQLAKSLFEVNQKTEKNITISSTELKAHCKHFDDELKEILHSINKPEVATYCGSVFIQLQNQVNVFKSQQQRLVNELHEDLIKFENERAKENEKILHVACEEIRKVGYFLPYEVQTFVEHEALKMNKLSLNNRRCYEDLKLTLTLVTEQTFKSFMDKVFCIRESWIRHKDQETLYTKQIVVEKKLYKVLSQDYVRFEVKDTELSLGTATSKAYCTCEGEKWTDNVERALAFLNSQCESLIKIYKKTINVIYNGFDCEIEEIRRSLNLLEISLVKQRVIKPIVFNAPIEDAKEFEDLEMYWQDSLPEIQSYYGNMMEFLLDIGKLWENHLERVCESKKLIFRALEKADSNNQAFIQDLEIKLNLALDALRQENDEAKLEKAYEAVVITLNSLKVKYESMYLEDVSTVEDFYKMMNLEADVLSATIKEFINDTHPMNHGKIIHSHADHIRYLPDDKSILKEIELCSYKFQGLKAWKQGAWVALETLSGKCRETLTSRAESWIANKIENLAEKKTIQLELLDKRFQRVRSEIYKKRLSEIHSHQELFDTHKEKIYFVLKKLKEEFHNLLAKESTKIDYVKDNLDEIEESVMAENFPGVIRGNQIMMERKKEELENEIKMESERFRADCSMKIFDLQQANIRFMKSIKLFYEGGDYSCEEGKTYITMLENLEKDIGTELKNILKDSSKEESDIIRKVTAMFNPVISIFGLLYEETLFNHEIQLKLRNFAEEIREITKTLKLDFEFLSDQCNCLCKSIKSTKASTDTEDTDADEKFWNFVIELLYRNVRNLLYPVSVPNTPVESGDENLGSQTREGDAYCCCTGKFSVNLTTSKTLLLGTTEKEKVFNCKDYRNQLFNCENPPEKDGTFMVLMCNYFWEEIDILQRAACEFYKKVQGRKLLREDLMPNNYDAFINQILTKFNYYNTQIQQFWLQIILDFLPLLGRIKSLANYFLNRKLEDYKNAALKTLENLEENFRISMESQACKNGQELRDLDNKLLPLHGYPQNADLLALLEEEVVRKTATQEFNREALLKKFKSQLKCFRVHHTLQKLEINKIEITYNKLREALFCEHLSNTFLDQILNYCNNGGFNMKKFSNENLSMEKEEESVGSLTSGEIPDEYKLYIVPSPKNLHSTQTYLVQLKQIIDWETSSDTKPTTCPPCPEVYEESIQVDDECAKFCKSKLNVLLEILDFELPAGKIIEMLDGYIRKLKVLAKSQEHFHEAELYKWLENWKYNVKKILKLYSVMYEEKEEKRDEKQSQQSA